MDSIQHPVRVLILEDNPIDKKIIQSVIEDSDLKITPMVVDNKTDYEKALRDFHPDVVLSDYVLPDFSGIDAIKIHQKVLPSIPLIIVTGQISEETAIDCLKLGAWDYIMKDHIKRLPVSIKNVLALREEREANRKKELRLSESERRYKTLSELTFEGIAIHQDGKLIDCNLSFCRMFGYERKELLNENFIEIIVHPHDKEIIENNVRSRVTIPYEISVVHKNGNVFPVEIEGKNELFEGEDVRVVAIRDITERKKAMADIKLNEQKFTKISNAAKDPIILIDHNGNVSFWNQAATNLFQYHRKEIMGKNLHEMIAPEKYLEKHKKGFHRFLETGEGPVIGKTVETEGKRKDGKIIPVELSLSSINIHGKWNALGILRDITARKKIEAEIMEAKKHAQDMNQMKTNFLSTMSHELRTPLNGIQGFAEILVESLEDPEYRDYAYTILKSSERILNTFNLIIDLAVLDANKVKVKKKTENLLQIVEHACESYLSEATEKNLYLNQRFTVHEAYAEIDQILLTQALNNLLNNAVKYTEKGGISVGLTTDKINNIDCFVVSVEDSGIGIPEEKASVIYQAFRQVSEGYNRLFEGMGLGLYITKRYVDLLEGNIEMKSQPGQGTRFTIYIPVRADQSLAGLDSLPENDNRKSQVDATKPKVLYVEDDPDHQQFVRIFLKDQYDLILADNGEIALDKVKAQKFDLIMMDINLGAGMNGLEVVQKIRQMPQYKDTPIAAVTANALVSQKNQLLASGCTNYIAKPFRKKKLQEFVKEALQN